MSDSHIYAFGVFTLNTKEKQLLKNGEAVPLMLKGYEVLALLVKLHGHLVEKERILKEVWPEKFVEESNIAQNIHHLRKALDEGEKGREFIETIPGRGYRFLASVREVFDDERVDVATDLATPTERTILIDLQATQSEELSKVGTTGGWRRRTKYLILASLTICAVGFLTLIFFFNLKEAPLHLGFKSLAVLPFKPLGTDSNDEMLGLGMADALITKLSNYSQIPVLPTSSVFRFVGRETDPLATGGELNVEVVLSGTVQRSGERVRVTVQLTDVKARRTLWANTFDEQFTNIFTLQDAISNQIVTALALKLNGGDRKELAHQTESVEAYQSYLMGLYFWNKRSKESLAKSIDYLRQALALDPNYAAAYALLADVYALTALHRYPPLSPAEAYEKSKAAAITANKLDGTLAQAHLALAIVKSNHERDLVGAEQSLKQAIALQPNYATARQRYGWHLASKGLLAEALAEMKRAQELDPLSAVINSAVASLFLSARDYDEALRYTRRAVEIDPRSFDGHLNMSEAYELKGMYKESLAALEKATELDPGNSYTLPEQGRVYALSGRSEKARVVLATLLESKKEDIPSYGVALIYLALNQRDEALKFLEKAVSERSVNSMQLRFDPKLDALRSDPRYIEILTRHNLERLLD